MVTMSIYSRRTVMYVLYLCIILLARNIIYIHTYISSSYVKYESYDVWRT